MDSELSCRLDVYLSFHYNHVLDKIPTTNATTLYKKQAHTNVLIQYARVLRPPFSLSLGIWDESHAHGHTCRGAAPPEVKKGEGKTRAN